MNPLAAIAAASAFAGRRAAAAPPALAWDALVKDCVAASGQTNVSVVFTAANQSHSTVRIVRFEMSCGCTAVRTRALPLAIKAGERGSIDVLIDVAGKRGTVIRCVKVFSTAGESDLTVRVRMDPPQPTGAQLSASRLASIPARHSRAGMDAG